MKPYPSISEFLPVVTVQSIQTTLRKRFFIRRKELKISRQSLTKRTGVSYGSIRRFESLGEISLVSFLKLSQAIGELESFHNLLQERKVKDLKDLK